MKRIYKNWLVRITLGFAALTSLRLVSTILHMTTLERIYKPRDWRKTSRLDISQEILDQLPRYCQNVFGQKMDPINLLFIGTESGITHAFEKSGWHSTDPSTPIHLLFGFLSSVFNRSYRRGPFMPLFISVGLQDMAFQKHGPKNKFAERHHIRVWRTRYELPGGNRLWVAAATHEVGMKIVLLPPFIVHKMNPDIDYERDFITGEMLDSGHLLGQEHALNKPISPSKPDRNPHGDKYYTDGHAKVIEII